MIFLKEERNMEKWDAYDINGNRVEGELIRNESIPNGLYHLVAEVLVYHVEGFYLLVQRDFDKEVWPGYFEATEGGSALKGENSVAAAKRELLEETGIVALSIEEIGELVTSNTIHKSFIATCDIPKNSVRLQDGETIAYKWVGKKELIDFLNSDECIPSQRKRLLSFLTEKI